MSVLTFAAGDQFTIRVVKSLTSNPLNGWANSYEAVAIDAGGESDLLTLGTAIVNFEKGLHKTVVTFRRLLISTWVPDSVPYNPEAFISTTLTAVGTSSLVGDQEALNTCLSVARVTSSGRFGHIFYRGALDESQVEAPAGIDVLVDQEGLQTSVDSLLGSSDLGNYLSAGSSTILKLAMISANGAQTRQINSLFVAGVSTLPTDHAWFNRT